MDFNRFYKIFAVILSIILSFIVLKFALPVFMPFLLGGLLSFTAEPAVRFGCRKLRLKRTLSAALGVGLTLAIVLCAALFLGTLAVKEVKNLASALPGLQETARSGITTLENGLLNLTQQLPDAVQPTVQKTISSFFADEGGLSSLTVRKLPEMAANIAGKVPGSALGLGTGILAAFLISARLPMLKDAALRHMPVRIREIWIRAKGTLGKWILAQGKLMLVTFSIVCVGLLLLKIPYAPAWAVLAALVDAVPLLGTGVLLLPWALVLWLQGRPLAALGLAGIYGAAALTRVVLEPRLVGKQLGLDPLAALVALYTGFRLWGFWGLVLAPVGASLVKNLVQKPQP